MFGTRRAARDIVSVYERLQQQKTREVVFGSAAGAAALLGLNNLLSGQRLDAAVLFFAVVVCLAGILMNRRGFGEPAGVAVTVILSVGLMVNVASGGGIHDIGIAAFPTLVILGSLLFGRRSLPLFVLGSILFLGVLTWLEFKGFIVTQYGADPESFLSLSVVLVVTGAIVRVIMRNLEAHLARSNASEAKIRQAYDLTLEGWALALEHRDGETEGHCRRVPELTVDLARAMGYPEEALETIRRGALLHDIGKMAIPDRILLKQGPLDPDEWEVMKQHPVIARDLLSRVPFLQAALIIPYYHHERWNGSGYPEGLIREQIPLPARIFAVVDTWDALTSDRPYRSAWSVERTMAYLRENEGVLFDPLVVSAFLQMMQDRVSLSECDEEVSDVNDGNREDRGNERKDRERGIRSRMLSKPVGHPVS